MKSKIPYQKKRKRIGRGPGSGHGKTSTRGHKGQGARSGYTQGPGFEGGQTPLYRTLPKRGFTSINRKAYAILNIDQIEQLNTAEISPSWLIENGIVKNMRDGLKVLGRGRLTKSVQVSAHRFSASAKEAIEKAGGKAVLIENK